MGEAVHYAMGAGSGLIYGIAAEVAPVTTAGLGLPFGAAVWLVADDVVVPALGGKTGDRISAFDARLRAFFAFGLRFDDRFGAAGRSQIIRLKYTSNDFRFC